MEVYTIMRSNVMNGYKKERMMVLVFLMVLFTLITMDINTPDPIPEEIVKFLEEEGYPIEDIKFTYNRGNIFFNSKLYQSSEPIFYKGRYTELWKINRIEFTTAALLDLVPYYNIGPYYGDVMSF